MITLFTAPKAFKGHIDIIQRNAIGSWLHLKPSCQVILLGNDEGIAEVAKESGAQHVPEIACNEFGTPLVSSLFETAEGLAEHDLMCYVNCDMILMNDFTDAVGHVEKACPRFLFVGQRVDLNVDRLLDFEQMGWPQVLAEEARTRGELHDPAGIDYFCFRKGQWDAIPPFAIGRPAWDNWMIYSASRLLKVPVIGATHDVVAIHQNHDYSHHPQGMKGVSFGTEAERNRALAGGRRAVYSLLDITHRLEHGQIKRTPLAPRLIKEFDHRYGDLDILRFPKKVLRVLRRKLASLGPAGNRQ